MAGNKNWKIIIAVIAAVLLVLAGWWLYKKQGVSPSGSSDGAGALDSAGGAGDTTVPSQSATRLPASSGISVPNATSSNVPANVAKPSIVTSAAPNSSASFRKFSISAGGGQFIPNTVIVNIGDTVHLDITAVDAGYDFTQPDYGFNIILPKGQAKVVEFQATAEGKYTFFCKACGGPAKGPVGYVVVAPK
ncbi:MAG: cupredoxin domain-containing protein [Candidatus Liptonbacteria bacterium]|nr:cupredoxin domain-containing protein [Candidatus Liptonbacteria bacterium]